MNKPEPLDPLIEGYLDYLANVGRKTPRTVIDVRCTLNRIVGAMRPVHGPTPLWKLELRDYLRWIEREREAGRGGAVLSKYVSHLRGLLDYAWRSGRSDRNVLDGFGLKDHQKRRPPWSLTVDQARKLVDACPSRTATQRRDRLIILLLYGCGLRTEELCRLDVGDVDRERRELLVRGKGDRERVVPIPEAAFTEVLAYLLERGGRRGPLLRTEAKRHRINNKVVRDAVRRAAEGAGIERLVTPKTLRHSYATHLMNAGVDLAVIASLMGHRSPSETGVYLHVLDDQPRDAVQQLDEEAEQ